MKGTLSLVAAPGDSLISIEEAAAQCRVTSTDEYSLLDGYIKAVTEYLEAKNGVLGEALITQTWRLSFPSAPDGNVEIPLTPVQSIASISYVDVTGATQIFQASNYRLVENTIELTTGAGWPATQSRLAAFWIDFVAGYGGRGAVPQTVRNLAKLMVADLFDNRAAIQDQTVQLSAVFKLFMASARSHRGLF